MQAKTVVKSIAVICLFQASLVVAAATAAERESDQHFATGKVNLASPAVSVETTSLDELTSQTIIPCEMLLAEERPDQKKPTRSGGAPPLLRITAVSSRVEAPVPPPDSTAEDSPAPQREPSTMPAHSQSGEMYRSVETQGECCNCFDSCKCGAPGNYWIRDEYLGWWAQGGHVPTLVTTSTTGSLPGTVPLYGDSTYNDRYRSGNWTQGGLWFDCCHDQGIQADYFFVGRESSPFFASSDGDPILTRPFIDATTGLPSEELIAVPGIVVGGIKIDNHNSLDGAGVVLRRNLSCCCNDCGKNSYGCESNCDPCWCGKECSRLDVIYGFRYYGFRDNLGISEHLTSIDPISPIAIGTQFDVNDSFVTQSNFYGFELGLIRQHYSGRWMMESTAKVALGDMNSIVWINGSTAVSFPGQQTAVNQGGLLALSSNIGRHEHNNFVAVPQISWRVGYRATEQLTFMAGYTLMYFSQIARAGDQIDTTVNPNLIPPPVFVGPNRPAFNFHPSDLLLQGITLGAEYSF